jgi:ATP-dependent RNA helicase DDX46/PRP5
MDRAARHWNPPPRPPHLPATPSIAWPARRVRIDLAWLVSASASASAFFSSFAAAMYRDGRDYRDHRRRSSGGGGGGGGRKRSRSRDRDDREKRSRFDGAGKGADEGGDIVARLAASISQRVVQQKSERMDAIEKELVTSSLPAETFEVSAPAGGEDQDEVRRLRQEKLKIWREQQELQKKQQEEEAAAREKAVLASRAITGKLGLGSTTLIKKSKGKGKLRAPSVPKGWDAHDADDVTADGEDEEDSASQSAAMDVPSAMQGSVVNSQESGDAAADNTEDDDGDVDPLDAFMTTLQSSGDLVEQDSVNHASVGFGEGVGVGVEAAALAAKHKSEMSVLGSNSITLDELLLQGGTGSRGPRETWESDAGGASDMEQDDPLEKIHEREEREEREKNEFLEALRKRDAAGGLAVGAASEEEEDGKRREDVKKLAKSEELGRLWEGEGDMMEEYERRKTEKDALTVLAESIKKKELKQVDHSKIEYIPIRKNLYIVPKALSSLSPPDVQAVRNTLEIKIRGKGCPPPVETWEQCGLSDRILTIITRNKWDEPFPIQKQAIPAIMSGRDVIGVAKTGSGKTLAFLLPMFRHILDQPPLGEREGPIGLIMAPARELAVQIYSEAKRFSKSLGLRVAAVYGGAGVADQIADLKRGADVVVCTPGRMIDILTMQAGRLISLSRVSYVVMDEADRMFDMGFEPQIKMITQNVRPDRQTVLFSATFPQKVEQLARKVLQFPLEIIAGGRSVASESITQLVEVREENEKYLRLLQLLGVWYERGNVLIFTDTQQRTDTLFQDLTRSGYPALSLHGGKDQSDREVTISDFKQKVRTLMVATSVAGRGLDVPELVCVINYSCPNHLEDYVHRVGRTGRAGRQGTAYTFISMEEEMHSPMLVKALTQAKQVVPPELMDMAENFQKKVEAGEARYASSGFSGRGFTFDDNEMTEEQRIRDDERHQYEIEQGLRDPSDIAGDREDQEAERQMAEEEEEDPAALAAAAQVAAGIPLTLTAGPHVPLVQDPFAAAAEKEAANKAAAAAAAALAAAAAIPSMSLPPPDPIAAAAEAAAMAKARATRGEPGMEAARAAALAVANRLTGKDLADSAASKAVEQAKLIAANFSAGTGAAVAVAGGPTAGVVVSTNANGLTVRTGADGTPHYEYSLVINDYPQLARWKVTQKETINQVIDRTNVAVTARGMYCAPGKTLPPNEEKLNLRIEAPSEMGVENAIAEFQRMLNDETLRVASHSSSQGKYKVV